MGCRILPNIESRASQRTIDAGHDLEQLGGVLEQTDAHPAFAHLTEADPRHQRHAGRVEQPIHECGGIAMPPRQPATIYILDSEPSSSATSSAPRSLQQAQRAYVTEFEPRIGGIVKYFDYCQRAGL